MTTKSRYVGRGFKGRYTMTPSDASNFEEKLLSREQLARRNQIRACLAHLGDLFRAYPAERINTCVES